MVQTSDRVATDVNLELFKDAQARLSESLQLLISDSGPFTSFDTSTFKNDILSLLKFVLGKFAHSPENSQNLSEFFGFSSSSQAFTQSSLVTSENPHILSAFNSSISSLKTVQELVRSMPGTSITEDALSEITAFYKEASEVYDTIKSSSIQSNPFSSKFKTLSTNLENSLLQTLRSLGPTSASPVELSSAQSIPDSSSEHLPAQTDENNLLPSQARVIQTVPVAHQVRKLSVETLSLTSWLEQAITVIKHTELPTNTTEPPSLNIDFSTIQSASSRLLSLALSAEALSDQRLNIPFEEINRMLPDILNQTATQLHALSKLLNRTITDTISGYSLSTATPEQIRSLELQLSQIATHLNEKSEKLMTELAIIGNLIEKDGSSHSISTGKRFSDTTPITEPTKLLNTGNSVAANHDQHFSPHQLRQPLESLLGRLESLQLLSRQVTTPSGEQQIIALPMKVGQEWTEVNIRFVKKRSNQKKSQHSPKHYSIALNVAPSQLGAIDVRMEYIQQKCLQLSVNFANTETKNWFSRNIEEIRSAISGHGLPLTQIELFSSENQSPSALPERKASKSKIDLTI